MKRVSLLTAAFGSILFLYACNDDDPVNSTPTPTPGTPGLLTATLNSQGSSSSATSGSSTATGNFTGRIASNVMSYTVTYSGITPTAITLDPTTTAATSTTAGSLLLAGQFPSSSVPGSGTSTTPGSGTGTTPGSGTGTTPGSGTGTTPGSGTGTTPGSGTSTTPGSGTGTTGVAITSPVSGTVSVTSARADSIGRGLYRINIRSVAFPNGEIGGRIQAQPQ